MRMSASVTTAVIGAAMSCAWQCWPQAVASVTSAVKVLERQNVSAAEDEWTPEAAARAIPLPVRQAPTWRATNVPLPDAPVVSEPGAGPTDHRPEQANKLFDLRSVLSLQRYQQEGIEPLDVGTGGAYYSSSRVSVSGSPQFKKYPYTTVGKLYFKVGTTWYSCSASVVRPRVLVTAGQCVHSGNGLNSGFYSSFQFVPSQNGSTGPYGTWDWQYLVVSGSWYYGGGTVPNSADYAMFEMRDKLGVKIGSRLGYLGYRTGVLYPNQATLVGYAGNFDSGLKMHEVHAGSAWTATPNCVEYGSDMAAGSGGGPWIANLGEAASGQSLSSGYMNQVIGVASYTYSSTYRVEGGSNPNSEFLDVLNMVCNHRSGNCS